MKVTERLQDYLKLRQISPYTFERTCGIANGYLKKQMKGKGSIGSEIVERITEKYKDLNITWLLTGKGQMVVSNYPLNDAISSIAEKEEEYNRNEQTIKSMREKILILENALSDKEKIIKLLEKQMGGQ